MIRSLFGPGSQSGSLKKDLDRTHAHMRGVAHRVANIATPGADFADVLAAQTGSTEGIDLEREMVALADDQLRIEAAMQMLRKTYTQLRTAFRERA